MHKLITQLKQQPLMLINPLKLATLFALGYCLYFMIVLYGNEGEEQLEPIDFCAALEAHFPKVIKQDNHLETTDNDFAIDYFLDDEAVSNKMLSLYAENALFELVILAKKQHWQIFDTGHGAMIDLENPEINGYENFKRYLAHVLKRQ